MKRLLAVIFVCAGLCGGCAHVAENPDAGILPPPALAAKATLTLDQIKPIPVLPRPLASTRPAPLEALALYGRARDAIFDHELLGAIGILQQAIAVDPNSFELYRALGETELEVNDHPTPEAIDAFEKALAIEPDNVRLRAVLASQFVTLNEPDKALYQLRLALLTDGYESDSVAAGMVDLLLARILEQQGYDRAALDEYKMLLTRLANPDIALRGNRDLAALADDPSTVWIEVGKLYQRQGRWADALAAYEQPASDEPSNLELQGRVVLMLANLGRTDDAVRRAAGVVVHFRASAESLAVLGLAFRGGATPDKVMDELARLYADNHDDRTMLLAFADVLRNFGRYDQAEAILGPAAEANPKDDQIARTLMDVDLQRDDVAGAARVLVLHLAAEPDSLTEFSALWSELLRPTRTHSLRVATLQGMSVPANARAAQLYLVSKMAAFWMRDALARSSLEAAVKISPPFEPAYRELAIADWQRRDWDEAQKQRATDALAGSAAAQGNAALAAEIRGIADSRAGKAAAAVEELGRAIALGSSSPEAILSYADALHQRHQDEAAQQLLWKLVRQRPGFSDGWAYLYQMSHEAQQADEAHEVLRQWLIADPSAIDAWLYVAVNTAENGDVAGAQSVLLKLFADHSDNEEVIESLLDFYKSARDINGFTTVLEDEHHRQPANRVVSEWLVRVYFDEGRTADARRVIQSTRVAVGKDADLLYQVAELYEMIQDHEGADGVLEEVLALDPHHAGASNDLGFDWAEHGENLARAETLIRAAVAAEPDNQSFLDSMGWVLYKEGKFAEAAEYMKKAIGPAALPDPEVIDHFGDVLYRLGKIREAAAQWQWALQRVDQETGVRDDLWQLRRKLVQKLAEEKAGLSVSVAAAGKK